MKLFPTLMTMLMLSSTSFAATEKAYKPVDVEKLDIVSREQIKKCSLIGNRFSSILEEMKKVDASYNGKCVSRAESMITGIQTDMSALQALKEQGWKRQEM